MALWHLRSKRKPTGGLLKPNKKKNRRERGSDFLEIKTGKRKFIKKRGFGGNIKIKALYVSEANVLNKNTGKIVKAKIISVENNPANPHYARRGTLTKGALIKTDIGLAKVTSRPGQDGVINAVLIEKN